MIGNPNIASKTQALLRASAMPSTVDISVAQSAKLDALLDVCDETASKIIVWCEHRNVVDAILMALRDIKGAPSAVHAYGGQTNKERTAAIDAFKTGGCRFW